MMNGAGPMATISHVRSWTDQWEWLRNSPDELQRVLEDEAECLPGLPEGLMRSWVFPLLICSTNKLRSPRCDQGTSGISWCSTGRPAVPA